MELKCLLIFPILNMCIWCIIYVSVNLFCCDSSYVCGRVHVHVCSHVFRGQRTTWVSYLRNAVHLILCMCVSEWVYASIWACISLIMAHICGMCIWKLKLTLVNFLKQSPLICWGKGSLEADLVLLLVQAVKFSPEFQLCLLRTGITGRLPHCLTLAWRMGIQSQVLIVTEQALHSLCYLLSFHLPYFEMMSTLACSFWTMLRLVRQ